LTDINMGDRDRMTWKAYPLVDHVADKICAILERHSGNPSTRFKDLIDLVAISRRAAVDADLQKRALAEEAVLRKVGLPTRFDVPDKAMGARSSCRASPVPSFICLTECSRTYS
jgi:hypothetical protein